MPTDIHVRPYTAGDEAHVLALWNAVMWADPIDSATWRIRYLLDPNFAAAECLVAVDSSGGRLVGFVLGMTAKTGGDHRPPLSDAWIVAFGVAEPYRREGVARTLFDQLEATWRRTGVGKVTVGPYVPSYITPGVDELAYPKAALFLRAWGAETLSRPLSMKASLTGYRPWAASQALVGSLESTGIRVRPADPSDILPLLQFLDEHFAHWRPDATSVLAELYGSDPRSMTMHVAEGQGRIIGYAQSRSERFGPFGVDEAYRGRGIGAVLLSSTLLAMRARGFHCAWFLWTSDRAAKLYREHGFEEVRRFQLMAKTLTPSRMPK